MAILVDDVPVLIYLTPYIVIIVRPNQVIGTIRCNVFEAKEEPVLSCCA